MLSRAGATVTILILATSCEMPPEVIESASSSNISDSTSDATPFITSDVPEEDKLLWSPPSWSYTVTVDKTGETLNLNNSKDYKVILPDVPMTGKLKINGGRNIVIIGGAFELQPSAVNNAALVVYDNSANTVDRTIHVEGVSFDMDDVVGPDAADAIAVAAPTATFQFQNIRITGIDGTHDPGPHPDAIQNWNGAKTIRVYKATVSTDYQGFYLPTADGPIGRITIQKVDFSRPIDGDGCPYYLWLVHNSTTCQTYPQGAYLSEVYVKPACYDFGAKDVFPNLENPQACKAELTLNYPQNELSWPDLPINGVVKEGTPPGGEFVPANVPGVNYVSPGYLLQ